MIYVICWLSHNFIGWVYAHVQLGVPVTIEHAFTRVILKRRVKTENVY